MKPDLTFRESLLAPVVSATAVLGAGLIVFASIAPGPLSIQMAQHLIVMNVLAPLLAALLHRRMSRPVGSGLFWGATLGQVALLWIWHAPSVQTEAAASLPVHLALMSALLVVSTGFWLFVLDGGWRALAGLLITGKLACLLGALMIFAARDIYLLTGLALPFCSTGPSSLEDQHMAGLLMVTACPLSYLVAGVVLIAQLFGRLECLSQAEHHVRAQRS